MAWGFVYGMMQVAWVTVLFLSQSYQVAVNLTTNERMLWRRMDYLHDDKVRTIAFPAFPAWAIRAGCNPFRPSFFL